MIVQTTERKPWRDPIVEETRRIRESLLADAGFDIGELCRGLRAREDTSGHPVIRAPGRAEPQPAGRPE